MPPGMNNIGLEPFQKEYDEDKHHNIGTHQEPVQEPVHSLFLTFCKSSLGAEMENGFPDLYEVEVDRHPHTLILDYHLNEHIQHIGNKKKCKG